ncbi:MAG TPA: hypothetical protein DCF68_10065, partial [Cyanothece sp. UBA12306]|nr:hypothetical protein [Cyanothece sp. UBA12306]
MEADLHNLYPSRADINSDRNNFAFAILPGSATMTCDFEVNTGDRLVEPQYCSVKLKTLVVTAPEHRSTGA